MVIERKVKIAGIQMSCVADKEANVLKALNLIDEAAKGGANIICLQELFSTQCVQFCSRDLNVFNLAEPIPGPTINRIAEKAKKHGVYIIAPIFEKAGPGLYHNSAPLINADGKVIGVYRKTHPPFVTSEEKWYFRAGSEFPVFKTPYGNIGVLICFDNSFPEVWRILELEGAELVFVPFAGAVSLEIYPIWEVMAKTRAFTFQVFAVFVNRTGVEKGLVERGQKQQIELFGNSMIVSPDGEVLARAGKNDEIVSAIIDLEQVNASRIKRPYLRDFRPEIYGKIFTQPKDL